MAEWRVVRSLLTLRDQINALAPGRSKASDGTIGDAAHQAGTSDHNPAHYTALGPVSVVCALDVTQDPAHGADMGPIAEALRLSRDRRIGYVIYNRRITGPNHGWAWDRYTGSDPHTNHMHVSTVHTAAADDTSPWRISTAPTVNSSKGDDMLFLAKQVGDAGIYLSSGERRAGPISEAQFARLSKRLQLVEVDPVDFDLVTVGLAPAEVPAVPAGPVTVNLAGPDLEAAVAAVMERSSGRTTFSVGPAA